MTPQDRTAIAKAEHPSEFHMTVGRTLRNSWSIWSEGTLIRNWFRNIGISHPDDISGMILERLWREVRGEPFSQQEFVAKTQDFWQQSLGRPIP